MGNVLNWKIAVDKGYDPSLYPYDANSIPMGNFVATMYFKIWSKKPCTINCYFIEKVSGRPFRLSVFRRRSDEVYTVGNSWFDFRECAVDCDYLITVEKNNRGNAVLKDIQFILPDTIKQLQ